MNKHPVSMALSNRMLQRIDQEAQKQRRSRSDWVEKYFEDLFSNGIVLVSLGFAGART